MLSLTKGKWKNGWVGGWLMGNFEPSLLKTPHFELGFKFHKKGEHWDRHAHQFMDEWTFVIKGHMRLNGLHIKKGEYIHVPTGFFAKPEFLSDVLVAVIKVPSVVGDKVVENSS